MNARIAIFVLSIGLAASLLANVVLLLRASPVPLYELGDFGRPLHKDQIQRRLGQPTHVWNGNHWVYRNQPTDLALHFRFDDQGLVNYAKFDD